MAKLKSGTRIYGDATVDNKLQITSGPVLAGTATSTGTASQRLQVTGGAYVSGSVGIGVTNPQYIFTVSDTGTPATVGLTNCLADFTTTANSYGQINLRNTSTGTNASSDVVITADNGSDTTNFIDLGINNSGFSVGSWTINGANDGYLYTSDGNLSIGAINASVAKYISFFTGGTLISNERMRVNATGVGIGTTNPQYPLQVQGNARVTGAIYDSSNSPGTSGQVLQSTVTGTQWTTAAAGGGSGTFDTGITTSVFISAISGVGINTAQNNDIFVGPGIAGTASGIGLSFPSTAGREYVIESIHVTNTYSNELYLNARHDFNTGSNTWRSVPIAQRLVVPYQGSVEIINQPMIANPQDHLRFQAMAGVGATATGIDGGLDVFTVYSTKTDTNFVGVGSTVASTSGAEVYRSTTYPSVVQSIRLCNYNLNIDIDASVSIYRGGTAGGIVTTGVRLGYLVYNMTIPKNSIVEILEKPKYLAINDTIVAVGSTINSLSACVSAKLIV